MGATSFSWMQDILGREIQSDLENHSIEEVWDLICGELGISPNELATRIATHFDIEVLKVLDPSPSTVQLIPEKVAQEYCIIPVEQDSNSLRLAVTNPTDREAIQQANFTSGRRIEIVVAPPTAIRQSIEMKYKESGELATVAQLTKQHISSDMVLVRGRTSVTELTSKTPPTEKLFLLVLKEAVNKGASDIHVQPFVGGAAVRLRIDGVMQQLKSMPIAVMERLIRHVKALADLDVTNSRTPQDGRLTLIINEEQRDLRVSILPVEQGERLVIRVLAHAVKSTDDLNFEEEQSALFRRSMQSTSGMVLVTGPTGSGKTTTLYAMLNLLNHDTTNIMSVEDPVEIKMRGVSQSSVHPEQGLTFPQVLRSMLRQDPDVILVGEIRDSETAELALRASLTGHLVLSTLHTIDAVTTIPRLIDLGLSPILIADAVLSVANQRLVRKNCDACKVEVTPATANDFESLYMQLAGIEKVWRSIGCDECGHDGYSGRAPVSQVWVMTDDVRNLLRSGNTDHDNLTKKAHQHGLRSLADSGRSRVNAGITSVEEAARVLGSGFWSELGSEGHSVLEVIGKTDRVSMHEKLLIVEPDEALQESLVAELEARQYVVTAVENAKQAAEELAKGEPLDLLLLDIENEHQSPLQSFNDLHSSLSLAGLSSVLLLPSGSETVETLLEVHGASDYLMKPATVSRTADLVEAVLKRRHL